MAGKVNLLPGEYRKQSLVTIEMGDMEAALFAPAKLEEVRKARPGDALRSGIALEEHYILTAHRLDGVYDYSITHDGETFRIPAKVFDRLAKMRESIIDQARKEQGKARKAANQMERDRLAGAESQQEQSDSGEDLDADEALRRLNRI